MSGQCRDCTFWKEVKQEKSRGYDEYRQCFAIDQNTESMEGEVIEPKPETLAAIDMFDDPYIVARFITKGDFGCVLFQKREDG